MAPAPSFDGIQVAYKPLKREIDNLWIEYGYQKMTLPKGWIKEQGRRPLPVDVIFEKDCPITLRDGVKIYADVFRPVDADEKPVPAILSWSIFWKNWFGCVFEAIRVPPSHLADKMVGRNSLDNFKFRMGIPLAKTSGLEKFEAPDPADWIPRGYAIVYPDARGTFKCEGEMAVYGTQEGRDGYDTIEWIGTQP